MPSFKQGDVVAVPFPYTNRATRQRRPALVVSIGAVEDDHGLLWVAMITSAENRGWPADVSVGDLPRAGLPAPSIVRPRKLATIDTRDATRLGSVDSNTLRRTLAEIGRELGLARRGS
ncbi:MAG: type II toxin-antitoxin system PemK/MazF family toxin [Alphaproteobacteria bacterium]|nr:type II toxin-antitoxin system PemK/MazF family toxin [Alphaproteobacteria bacterium]